jgi:hypothetical protein
MVRACPLAARLAVFVLRCRRQRGMAQALTQVALPPLPRGIHRHGGVKASKTSLATMTAVWRRRMWVSADKMGSMERGLQHRSQAKGPFAWVIGVFSLSVKLSDALMKSSGWGDGSSVRAVRAKLAFGRHRRGRGVREPGRPGSRRCGAGPRGSPRPRGGKRGERGPSRQRRAGPRDRGASPARPARAHRRSLVIEVRRAAEGAAEVQVETDTGGGVRRGRSRGRGSRR